MTLFQLTSDPPMNTILYPSSASGGHNMNLRLAFHCLLLHKPLKVMYSLLMVDSLLKGCESGCSYLSVLSDKSLNVRHLSENSNAG